ncbi:hypothetical protein ACSBR2_034834 [Camellia fascicularis]
MCKVPQLRSRENSIQRISLDFTEKFWFTENFSGQMSKAISVPAGQGGGGESVQSLDANGDGKILATELISVMKALQSNTSENEVKRMMEELDTDIDCFISLEELASFCKGGDDTVEAVRDDDGTAGLKDAFKLYDQDKNGVISSLRSTRERERVRNQKIILWISSITKNGNGTLD